MPEDLVEEHARGASLQQHRSTVGLASRSLVQVGDSLAGYFGLPANLFVFGQASGIVDVQ